MLQMKLRHMPHRQELVLFSYKDASSSNILMKNWVSHVTFGQCMSMNYRLLGGHWNIGNIIWFPKNSSSVVTIKPSSILIYKSISRKCMFVGLKLCIGSHAFSNTSQALPTKWQMRSGIKLPCWPPYKLKLLASKP